jgi:predicted O-linked N-acetylglucosamine transferase (SPINDLY family)
VEEGADFSFVGTSDMSEAATSHALRRAIEHLHAGSLQLAEALFREVMARDPACVDAVHSLGVIALQRGQHTVALELIHQAAALAPDNASIHSNLGETYRNLRRFDEAVASFCQALALQPEFTDEILYLWVRILQQVPRSRLTVKNLALRSRSVVRRLHAFFENRGIASDRVALISHQNSPLDHLESYDRVDLGLDTFPYHGTTTTCEALWMGVPVITLAGRCHVARVGASLLTNVGLSELVTGSPDAYVESAVATARDLVHLATLRAGLRERMQRSPLMDAPRFARNLEAAYRTMWHRWCAQPAPASVPTR